MISPSLQENQSVSYIHKFVYQTYLLLNFAAAAFPLHLC